jgi:DNA-binding GntR family transcriptional regulator
MSDPHDLRLADRAYLRIKERLADLDLMPGDHLSEKELAEQFEISRTPIREALQRLHHEDLLSLSPKLGWTVPKLDFEKIDRLYDFRILIEKNAVRVCAEKLSMPSSLRELEPIWQVSEQNQINDPKQVGRLDEIFHQTLVKAAGNAEITRVHAEITEKIRLIRRLDFTKPARISATYKEHQSILKLIASSQGDQAQESLSSHITASKIESRAITLEAMFRRGQNKVD